MVRKCWTKSTLLGLGLGQLLSLLLTFIGFTSSQLANKGIFAPASQCLLIYILLILVYGSIMVYRLEPVKAKHHHYSILALVDVFAKNFVITAYRFTSLTSVMLLDCWTIPCVIFLTWLFCKTKYGIQKLIGITICVAGLVTVVLSDLHSSDTLTRTKALRGDLFVVVGATLYGVSNVLEETIFKKADRVEIMACLGYYGTIVVAPQIAVFERSEFKSIISSPEAIFLVTGFSIAMFLFYLGVPLLLEISGSTMLNLSLLTSNVWAVLIQIFACHEKVDWIYFLAFAVVILGLVVYSGGNEMNPINSETPSIDEEADLGHSDNARISSNDGSRISFQGVRNSLCYISCIINIHRGDVREV